AEFTTDAVRGVGFEVPHVELTDAAEQVDVDARPRPPEARRARCRLSGGAASQHAGQAAAQADAEPVPACQALAQVGRRAGNPHGGCLSSSENENLHSIPAPG